ncbi:MAG: hypothetical protein NVS9B10_08700 [Nevskia sp.]
MPERPGGMNPPAFERYVGIDWSGAAQAGAVLDWLRAELQRGPRLLVGFDFAFALPGDGRPLAALWAEVETHCAQAPDLLGRAYAERDPRFWQRGPQPARWNQTPRATERACRAAGLGSPQTPFQLIGAKQVGKGALAGMRLLHRLHREAADRLAIWPFDAADPAADARSFCVEIYPRLFIRRAGLGNRKLRDRDDLNQALNRFDSLGIADGTFDDHEADALVSAAGLRRFADDAALWRAGAAQAEGWIFGVP